MKFRIHGINIDYDQDPKKALERAVIERLDKAAPHLAGFEVVRRSIDARSRPIKLIFSVDVTVQKEADGHIPGGVEPVPIAALQVKPGESLIPCPPIVVGGGPSGLFAALLLAEHGYRPLLFDRGSNVQDREKSLFELKQRRKPNPECNALFGLGGAGTFSDGKLNTGIRHPWLRRVLEVLVDCGAPDNILTDAKPHVGTDMLRKVVDNLVRRIETAGGKVCPGVRVDQILHERGQLKGVLTTTGRFDASHIILAIGHSARDTWEMLAHTGVKLEPKPFQMGIRVEHPQEWLDRIRYGQAAGHPALGPADYKLATKAKGTPVFSFCMCPGGETLPTINEPGHLALNGMSFSARNSPFASSGIVVTLHPDDYGGNSLSTCLSFLRSVEQACFKAAGSNYDAPAQRLIDFAKSQTGSGPLPTSSYLFGITPTRLDEILPGQITTPIRTSLSTFNKTLNGYLHPKALVLAPESRASSPIRIVRNNETLESPSMKGLYPVGEGAGYAGGIMSSALDGLNAAKKIITNHAIPK